MIFLYVIMMFAVLANTSALYSSELFKINGMLMANTVIDDDLYSSITNEDNAVLKYDTKTKILAKQPLTVGIHYSKFVPYDQSNITGLSYSDNDVYFGELSIIDKKSLNKHATASIPTLIAATTMGDSILVRTSGNLQYQKFVEMDPTRQSPTLRCFKIDRNGENPSLKECYVLLCDQSKLIRGRNMLASLQDHSVISLEEYTDKIIRRSPETLQEDTIIQHPGDGVREIIADEAHDTLFVRNDRSIKLYSLKNNKFMHSISYRRTSGFAYSGPKQTLAVTPTLEGIACEPAEHASNNVFFYDIRKLEDPVTYRPSSVFLFKDAGVAGSNISFSQSSEAPKVYLALENTMYEIDPAKGKWKLCAKKFQFIN